MTWSVCTPSSNGVRVAVVNATSTISGVHWSFGHVGVGGRGSGSSVSMVNTNAPFRGVGSAGGACHGDCGVLSRCDVAVRVGALDRCDAACLDRDPERRPSEPGDLAGVLTVVPSSVHTGVPAPCSNCMSQCCGDAEWRRESPT
jgi:hypothetical protein